MNKLSFQPGKHSLGPDRDLQPSNSVLHDREGRFFSSVSPLPLKVIFLVLGISYLQYQANERYQSIIITMILSSIKDPRN